MPVTPTTLGLLFGVGAAAGLVDAIAGGGGLLTLPAILLTGLPPHVALGTNKGQGVFGTGVSLGRFWHSPLLDRRRAAQSFVPGLAGAAMGAWIASRIPSKVLSPIIMALLLGVAIFMIVGGPKSAAGPPRKRSFFLAAAVASIIACYDGFFGPGTGTFCIMAYVWLWCDRLDSASANAKVVNFASNLASMVTFAAQGLVVWSIALPMAAGQVIGGFTGAHLTVRIGRPIVRYAVIAVSVAFIVRLAFLMAEQ